MVDISIKCQTIYSFSIFPSTINRLKIISIPCNFSFECQELLDIVILIEKKPYTRDFFLSQNKIKLLVSLRNCELCQMFVKTTNLSPFL